MEKDKRLIIDFWGDITCPFCYLAGDILAKAIEDLGYQSRVEVHWRSCLLRPDWSVGQTMVWKEVMNQIKVPEERVQFEKKTALLKRLSDRYELYFNLNNAVMHNSVNAARILKLASEKGLALPLAVAFGKGFYEEAMDLSRFDNLIAKSEQVGLDVSEVKALLEGDKYLPEVEEEQSLAMTFAYNFIPAIYFGEEGSSLEGLVDDKQVRDALESAMNAL